MKRILLNKTDLLVSPVCLGTDHFGGKIPESLAFEILDAFCEHGGNFIDTAAVYGMWLPSGDNVSEQVLGRWLRERKARGKMCIATKGGHYDLKDPSVSRVTKKEVAKDIETSLKTLGLETISFYWLHRDNPGLAVGEILEMMEDFVAQGKIRFYGASNYTAERLEEADRYAKKAGIRGFSAVSNQWSPVLENADAPFMADPSLVKFNGTEELDLFRRTGMAFVPYNATARGYFAKKAAGKAGSDLEAIYGNPQNEALYQELSARAGETGRSLQTLLLEKILSFDIRIIPTTSVSKTAQLEDLWPLL